MLYLRLSRNQGQVWSSVTVLCFAKNWSEPIILEEMGLESTSNGERPMIQALPRLVGQHRCGIFGRKCSLVDLQQEQKYGYDKQTCISDNLSHKF